MDKINYYLDRIELDLEEIKAKLPKIYKLLDNELDNAYDYADNDNDFLNQLRFLNNRISKVKDEL